MSHYFVDDPNLNPDERSFSYYAGNAKLNFVSDAGLFSHGHMDAASDLLLRVMMDDKAFSVHANSGGRFLDLGCAWGAVGVSVGKLYPALRMIFADVNPKALRFAEKNARANGIDGVFILSDGFDKLEGHYDIVALNPPIHAGKDICRSLLKGAAERLNCNGALYVVMHKKHGAVSMIEELSTLFCVEILHNKKGVLVFQVCKKR